MDHARSVANGLAPILPVVNYGDKQHDDGSVKAIRLNPDRATCGSCNQGVYHDDLSKYDAADSRR